jgi:hypothetical protein
VSPAKVGLQCAAAVDGGDEQGVFQALVAQGPAHGDDVAAVDQPPAEAAVAHHVRVEMQPRRVLVQARGEGVVRLVQRHAGGMVDALALLVVLPAPGTAGEAGFELAHVEESREPPGDPV